MRAAEFKRRLARADHEARQGEPSGRAMRRYKRVVRALVRKEAAGLLIPYGKRIDGYVMRNGEFVCRKDRYNSREHAESRMQLISFKRSEGRAPARAYQCEWCNGWHLTHTKEC